jgi:toluene monooxygenase system protein D
MMNPGKDNLVGPVLESSPVGQAVVRAIREVNAQVEIRDRGAYLRVLVPEVCRVTRAAIERELGGAFRFPSDLECVMPSFQGLFHIDDETATWSLRGPSA